LIDDINYKLYEYSKKRMDKLSYSSSFLFVCQFSSMFSVTGCQDLLIVNPYSPKLNKIGAQPVMHCFQAYTLWRKQLSNPMKKLK
jgi:hypothetical protein